MMKWNQLVCLTGVLGCLVGTIRSVIAAEGPSLEVSAGNLDRKQTVVWVTLPEDLCGNYRLRGDGGVILELQRNPIQTKEACFLLPELRKGNHLVLKLEPVPSEGEKGVEVNRLGNRLELSRDGREMFSYQMEAVSLPRADIPEVFLRGGYLHPIRTPSGLVISDDYPTNHLHHHGIWSAWSLGNYKGVEVDFWNSIKAQGTVRFKELKHSWSGPVHGGFESVHEFVLFQGEGKEPLVVLEETWKVVAYAVEPGVYCYDFESRQRNVTQEPLVLPEYRYGGIGFRGHVQWDGKDHCFFLTSSGERDRVKGHATRADWCHISGQVDGRWGGIAVLCSPENFRSPQPMRIHPTEPFFNYAPQQAGEFRIHPGETYRARYRYVVTDGKGCEEELRRWWGDYSEPPTVRWQ